MTGGINRRRVHGGRADDAAASVDCQAVRSGHISVSHALLGHSWEYMSDPENAWIQDSSLKKTILLRNAYTGAEHEDGENRS